MTPFLKLFDIVPGWLWAAAVTAAVATNCGTAMQRDAARNQVAKLTTQIATETAQRERVARQDAETVAKAQFRHAERQQEITNENAKRAAARAAADRARAADDQRLRSDILAATRGREEAGADAAACRRDLDLARQLAADLGEAVELQGEAEAVIRQRDDEVMLLLQQIETDRAAVKAAQ